MRLQLAAPRVLAILLAVGGGAAARADEPERQASGSVRVYADDDRVTVVTPTASVDVPLGKAWLVSARAGVDMITAASVDVVTSASPSQFEENRVEGALTGAFTPLRRRTFRLGAIAARESDFSSLRAVAGARAELFGDALTLDLAYSGGVDRVGTVDDPTFARSRQVHELTASATQVLDRATYLDVVVAGSLIDGYQANPYRLVPLVTSESPAMTWVDEVTPERRLGGAVLARVRRAFALPVRSFVHAEYRFTRDDWGVTSHTGAARVIVPIGETRVTVACEGRGYWQSAADFYRSSYQAGPGGAAPELRTRDRTLGGMRSFYAAGIVDVALGDGGSPPHAVISVGGTRFLFDDYPAQARRTALLAILSLATTF